MKINCLTLYQPWAGLISIGLKTIETRTHEHFKFLNNRWIAIHAAKKVEQNNLDVIVNHYKDIDLSKMEIKGAIICIAFVYKVGWLDERHSKSALINCAQTKRFGLFLSNIQPIEPIFIPGKQGVWSYDFNDEQIKGLNLKKPNELL